MRLLIALLIFLSLPSLAFSFINPGEFRNTTLIIYYNPEGAPDNVTAEQVAAGIYTWNTAGAGMHAVYGGITNLPPSRHLGYSDGANVIGWGGTSLGSANYSGAECDISLGAVPYDWTYYSVSRVVAHEVGHCLGLGHSDISGAIMYPSVGAGTDVTLAADDVAGLRAAYPPYKYRRNIGLP